MHKQSNESGIIRLPKIAPHLRVDFVSRGAANAGKALMVTSPYDQDYCRVYPASELGERVVSAVDGRTTATKLIQRLTASSRHRHSDIADLLAILAKADILISGEYEMPDGQAALWLNIGYTPALVESVLSQSRIAVVNQAQSADCQQALVAMLNDLGLRVASGNGNEPTLTAVVVDDYLQESLARVNRDYWQAGRAWLPVQLSGAVHQAGPVFNQAASEQDASEQTEAKPHMARDFCWRCLAERIEHSRQIEQAKYRQTGDAPRPAAAMHSAALRASAYRIALAIARHLLHAEVDGVAASRFASSTWVSDQVADQSGWHLVNKNPVCAVCGEAPPSELAAIELDDAQTGTRYVSSGWRIKPPERTFSDYRHLNNAYTGVVDVLDDLQNPVDDSCFISESGNNIATRSDSVLMAMMSTRMRNAGKGTTPASARAGALCEAIERYSTSLHGNEIRKLARYR
ncbi:MAG: TOMM precursor leader peptide-binding protein, partial [bacterium]